MILPAFYTLPHLSMAVDLAAHLAVGTLLGIVYFRSLWWSACRFTSGGSLAVPLALMVARFAAMGGILLVASLEGALPLLTLALGFLLARFTVTRKIRQAA